MSNIVVCTNHKTGTMLFAAIFKKYSNAKKIQFIRALHNQSPHSVNKILNTNKNNCLFYDHCFQFNNTKFPPDFQFKGIHIYRHPHEIIMSGVRYHQKTDESWCAKRKLHNQSITYQQKIKQLGIDEKIIFETENCAKSTINDIYNFINSNNLYFINIKLEDINLHTEEIATKIANHLELDTKVFVKIFCNLVSGKKNSAHVTNKTSNIYTFQQHFKDIHYQRFKELFPQDIMTKLKYNEIFKKIMTLI